MISCLPNPGAVGVGPFVRVPIWPPMNNGMQWVGGHQRSVPDRQIFNLT